MSRAAGFFIAVFSIAVAGCGALPARVVSGRDDALAVAQYGSLADFAGRIEAMLGRGESADSLLALIHISVTTSPELGVVAGVWVDVVSLRRSCRRAGTRTG